MSIPLPTEEKKELTNSSQSLSKSSKQKRYTIELYKYPSDLGSPEHQHYIEIQINVRGKSVYNKDNRMFEVNRNPDAGGLSDEELSQSAKVAAVGESALVGYGIGQKIFKIFDKTGAKRRSRGVSGGGLVGGAVSSAFTYKAMSSNELLKPDTKYRISDVIQLHIPSAPSVRYSTNWANKDLGTLAGIISGSAFQEDLMKGAGESFAAFSVALAKLPGVFGAIDVKDLISASAGTALNPFKETIFESVDFRSFAFSYKFMPRSQDETRQIEKIIQLFKFHMHPELSDGKLFFINPSEFQLTYYFGGDENKKLHKFAPCILESVDITYGEGQFSTFHDGMPTEINMKLTFREIEILTKKQVEQGY